MPGYTFRRVPFLLQRYKYKYFEGSSGLCNVYNKYKTKFELMGRYKMHWRHIYCDFIHNVFNYIDLGNILFSMKVWTC